MRGQGTWWVGVVLFVLVAPACVHLPPKPPVPSDWIPHRVCEASHCIEVIEIGAEPHPRRATAMLVPGMFQNGASFDPLPEQGISFARFLVARGVKVYLVHVRGIGGADFAPESNLDDIVVEDLPLALDFVYRRAGEPVIVLGQSQGSITLKAFLAGLSRCGKGVCFRGEVARARQAKVHSAGFFTGNVGMTSRDPRVGILGELGGIFGGLLDLFFDRIEGRAAALTAYRLFGRRIIDVLSVDPRISSDVHEAFLSRTVEASSVDVALQFADAIRHRSVRSGRQRWVEALRHIQVPVIQTTFGDDPFAPPLETWRDDFRYIGSKKKKFKRVRRQAHEDWMMDRALHAQHWMTVEELIDLW